MILRSLLPRIHYYHNKQLQVKESQYLIPTYSWTLTPIPNWTCFAVTISHFNAWLLVLTNQFDVQIPVRGLLTNLRKMLAAKFFSSIGYWGYKSRCTNTAASSRERWTRTNFVFGHNLHEHNFASHLHNLWRLLKQSLYIFRVERKKIPNMYSWIEVKSVLKNWFS